jgi:hypothetical protein
MAHTPARALAVVRMCPVAHRRGESIPAGSHEGIDGLLDRVELVQRGLRTEPAQQTLQLVEQGELGTVVCAGWRGNAIAMLRFEHRFKVSPGAEGGSRCR